MHMLFGVVGAFVVAASALWYLADVLRRNTRPHQASWAVWAVVGLLGFGTSDLAGAGPGAYSAAVDAVACCATFAISLHPSFGKPGLRRTDLALGAAAIAAAGLWRFGGMPTDTAALLAVACDVLALWPTLREAVRHPELESRLSWGADVVGNGLCVAAVASASFAALAFPVYLLAACVAMSTVLLLSRDRRPRSGRSSQTRPSLPTPPARSTTRTPATPHRAAAFAASSAARSGWAGAAQAARPGTVPPARGRP
jgi:hypothetical protein